MQRLFCRLFSTCRKCKSRYILNYVIHDIDNIDNIDNIDSGDIKISEEEIIARFYRYCAEGNTKMVKSAISQCGDILLPHLKSSINIAINSKHRDILAFLLDTKISLPQIFLDDALTTVVKNGNLDLAELLVRKGANPIAGIKVSKSNNITTMLYKYKNPKKFLSTYN
jgi:hypothetical protein